MDPFASQQLLRQQMMVQWMQMQTPRPHTHAKGGQPTETQNAPTPAFREQTNKERKLLWYKQALEKGKAKGGKKGGKGKGKASTNNAEEPQPEEQQEQHQAGNQHEQNTEEDREENREDPPESPADSMEPKAWWEDNE